MLHIYKCIRYVSRFPIRLLDFRDIPAFAASLISESLIRLRLSVFHFDIVSVLALATDLINLSFLLQPWH